MLPLLDWYDTVRKCDLDCNPVSDKDFKPERYPFATLSMDQFPRIDLPDALCLCPMDDHPRDITLDPECDLSLMFINGITTCTHRKDTGLTLFP